MQYDKNTHTNINESTQKREYVSESVESEGDNDLYC